MLGRATGNTDTQDSPRPGLGGSHHLPPYSIHCSSRSSLHPNGFSFPRLPRLSRGSPEIAQLWTPASLKPYNFRSRPPIELPSEAKFVGLVETFRTVCRTLSAPKYFGSIPDFYWSGVKTGGLPGVRLPGLLLAITCVSDVQMSNASPF